MLMLLRIRLIRILLIIHNTPLLQPEFIRPPKHLSAMSCRAGIP